MKAREFETRPPPMEDVAGRSAGSGTVSGWRWPRCRSRRMLGQSTCSGGTQALSHRISLALFYGSRLASWYPEVSCGVRYVATPRRETTGWVGRGGGRRWFYGGDAVSEEVNLLAVGEERRSNVSQAFLS